MLESKLNLQNSTVDSLQELIRTNIDSQKGFTQAAETIEDAGIATLFREIAADRGANAGELQRYVALNNETPEEQGSTMGAMHRWWLSARGTLNGGDDHVVLIEAERGEDTIKHKYEEVLKETAGSPMNAVLQKQYSAVKAQHDRIRALRDQRAA